MLVKLAALLLLVASGDAMAQERFQLPAPHLTGTVSLEEALHARRSVRELSEAALPLADVGQILWAVQGITDPAGGLRTAPSAGALYPLEIYLVVGHVEGLPPGTYHYDSAHHRLDQRSEVDVRASLADAAHDQSSVSHNAALVVITGVEARLSRKYGQRATRYMAMEAGHAAQNLLLQATALGLGSVPVGAFDDLAVATHLGLSNSERPLYLLPIGKS